MKYELPYIYVIKDANTNSNICIATLIEEPKPKCTKEKNQDILNWLKINNPDIYDNKIKRNFFLFFYETFSTIN